MVRDWEITPQQVDGVRLHSDKDNGQRQSIIYGPHTTIMLSLLLWRLKGGLSCGPLGKWSLSFYTLSLGGRLYDIMFNFILVIIQQQPKGHLLRKRTPKLHIPSKAKCLCVKYLGLYNFFCSFHLQLLKTADLSSDCLFLSTLYFACRCKLSVQMKVLFQKKKELFSSS